MITLPADGLEVERDVAAEEAMVRKAAAWLETERRADGIHVGDLLFPRKGYWRRVDPRPPDSREVGLYLVGRVLHAFILAEQGQPVDLAVTDEGQRWSEEFGLYYSPDKLVDGEPVEIKTSRSYYEPKTLGDIETYLRQLLAYMVITHTRRGRLLVLYLNARDEAGKTHPQFRAYTVTLTDDAAEALRLSVLQARDHLADALRRRDHRGLPVCPEWACAPAQCPWWARCQPDGRYGDPAYLTKKRR